MNQSLRAQATLWLSGGMTSPRVSPRRSDTATNSNPCALMTIDHLRQRGDSLTAIAAAIVHKDDVAAIVFSCCVRLIDHALNDRGRGRRRLTVAFAPVVRDRCARR